MHPSPGFKITRRVVQACDNCRRKKTRCPGQRPTCSTCERLNQHCVYGRGHNPSGVSRRPTASHDLENRLAQLEDTVRTVSSGLQDIQPIREMTESDGRSEENDPEYHRGNGRRDPSLTLTTSGSASACTESVLPPSEYLSEMAQLYRHHFHRQPLWLFDDEELASLSQQPEELVLAILVLTTRFSTIVHSGRDRDVATSSYGNAARNLVMTKMATATVTFSTIQSFCLLAYSGFAAGDTSSAPLYLNLTRDLLRSAGFDTRHTEVYVDERTKRLFWSVYMLEQLYGACNNRTISISEGFEKAHYRITTGKQRGYFLNLKPPEIPQEISPRHVIDDLGMWTCTLYLTAYWNEVRNYILINADGVEQAPWDPESYYTFIVSCMHELETHLPQQHRWDSKQFAHHLPEELLRDRSYWSPWLFLQSTYDLIYMVINHPFLIASRLQNRTTRNTFWRSATEQGLLHSTWIVRLITMAQEKQFDLSDPFLGYIAGVAASVLMFHCRSEKDEVRLAARDNFEKCRAFVASKAQVWPWCYSIKQNLDRLVEHAFGSSLVCQPSRKITIDTTALLEILDYGRFRKSEGSLQLFDKAMSSPGDSTDTRLATIEIANDSGDVAGQLVAPSVWLTARNSSIETARQTLRHDTNDISTTSNEEASPAHGGPADGTESFSLPVDDYSETLLHDIFSADDQWWDGGA